MRRPAPLTFRQLKTLFGLAYQLDRCLGQVSGDFFEIEAATVQVLEFVARRTRPGDRCIAEDVFQGVALSKSSATRQLKLLQARGLVEELGPGAWGSDGRRRALAVTDKGTKLLGDFMDVWKDSAVTALRPIDSESLKALGAALDELQDAPAKLERASRPEGLRVSKGR